MPALVDVQCPDCQHAFRIEYRLLGSAAVCPGCQSRVTAAIAAGTTYPSTGWELTFRDFLSLIQSSDSRSRIAPLLRSWFDYGVNGTDASSQVTNPQGEAVELLELHLRIQDDPTQQHELYQAAMSLWR
jgi:hypothetical protein